MATILLVEPYFTGSHRSWAEGYAGHSTHEVHLITLPGRFWRWRMFGGAISMAEKTKKLLNEIGQPDVLIASDMLDLPAYLGHAGSELGDPRVMLYMHENQLTYPVSPRARDLLAYQYINWSSMVRADEIWLNSEFHSRSLFGALPKFLGDVPDFRHSGLLQDVVEKSRVVPVGVDFDWVVAAPKPDPPLIIWNHRWEHDKDPLRFFQALYRLLPDGPDFRLAICGENFRNVPQEFDIARERLGERITQYGYAERGRYEELLLESSVVVSTAQHEFFGVGVVEAVAAGALPVLPNGLSYPELIPGEVHAETLYETDDELDHLLRVALSDAARRSNLSSITSKYVRRFSWTNIAPRYDERLPRGGGHTGASLPAS